MLNPNQERERGYQVAIHHVKLLQILRESATEPTLVSGTNAWILFQELQRLGAAAELELNETAIQQCFIATWKLIFQYFRQNPDSLLQSDPVGYPEAINLKDFMKTPPFPGFIEAIGTTTEEVFQILSRFTSAFQNDLADTA